MLDTATSRERPSAASQAANTSRTMGIMLVRVVWVVRVVMVIITNKESISPSRHKSDDIRCDRYMSRPRRDMVKAIIIFMWVRDMLIIMSIIII